MHLAEQELSLVTASLQSGSCGPFLPNVRTPKTGVGGLTFQEMRSVTTDSSVARPSQIVSLQLKQGGNHVEHGNHEQSHPGSARAWHVVALWPVRFFGVDSHSIHPP